MGFATLLGLDGDDDDGCEDVLTGGSSADVGLPMLSMTAAKEWVHLGRRIARSRARSAAEPVTKNAYHLGVTNGPAARRAGQGCHLGTGSTSHLAVALQYNGDDAGNRNPATRNHHVTAAVNGVDTVETAKDDTE